MHTNNPIVPQNPAAQVACCLTNADINADGKPYLAVSNDSDIVPIVAVLINTTSLGEQPPPGGGSGSTEKGQRVLVNHKGKKELCLPKAALRGHLKYGDEIIDEEGCSDTEQRGLRDLW